MNKIICALILESCWFMYLNRR